ncbi:MAG: iron chaperone [Acidimicrobiia bacterium]
MAETTDAGRAAVDGYLDSVSEPQRTTLLALRTTLRKVMPTAQERISYGMPTFAIDGKSVASYAAFKNHCSYFPHSGGVLGAAGPVLAEYHVSKGTLQFAIDKPLPIAVVRTLVKLKLREIAEAEHAKRTKRTGATPR